MSYVFSARHTPVAGANIMKPVVFVIGASGNIGKATVHALSLSYGRKIRIKAGVRNPEKVRSFKSLVGVTVVQAEMGQKDELKETFKGVDVLYIVCPGAENRAQLSIATAEAAKEADVKHLLVVSVVTADNTDILFGKQFNEIETAVSSLGVAYTLLRLPHFTDNYLAYQATIRDKNVFYGPVDPNKPFATVTVEDAASAATAILVSPAKHAWKTYTIVSDRHTFDGVAEAFSKGLSRKVRYVRVSYEDTKALLVQKGLPEWQVGGLVELWKLIDSGSAITNPENVNDFSEITGRKPTGLSTWVMRVASAFK